MGYALGSFFMLLGFLTSKPDTWETCYKPCYAEKFAANETTAEKLCVDQCVIEDAADGSHFNGSILYIISQGIIGMCSPFGIVASSFIVDVSVDYNSFVKNYAHMRAFGFAGGLGFGLLLGDFGRVGGLAGGSFGGQPDRFEDGPPIKPHLDSVQKSHAQ